MLNHVVARRYYRHELLGATLPNPFSPLLSARAKNCPFPDWKAASPIAEFL
jgi:hypothetical protein